MKLSKNKKLFLSLLFPQLAGGIGSIFTSSSIPVWYRSLIKPSLNPPSWVFGPVWTTLFVLMGIACYLIWKKIPEKNFQKQISKLTGTQKTLVFALSVYGVQLLLNTLWSFLFFGIQNPGLALIEIILLWIFILYTIVLFYKIDKVAAYLLFPYLAWVSFATYLNYALWTLNH